VKGRFRAQSVSNCFQYTIQVVHNVAIPESQNSIVVLAQPLIAQQVARIVNVLAAVDFKDQSLFAA
jgi:hypothetical protein